MGSGCWGHFVEKDHGGKTNSKDKSWICVFQGGEKGLPDPMQ